MELFAKACPDLRKFSSGGCGFGVIGLSALLRHCTGLEDLTIKRRCVGGVLLIRPQLHTCLHLGSALHQYSFSPSSTPLLVQPHLHTCSHLLSVVHQSLFSLSSNSSVWFRPSSDFGSGRLPELRAVVQSCSLLRCLNRFAVLQHPQQPGGGGGSRPGIQGRSSGPSRSQRPRSPNHERGRFGSSGTRSGAGRCCRAYPGTPAGAVPGRPPLAPALARANGEGGPSASLVPQLDLPESLNLRRLCLKDQSVSLMWAPLLEAARKVETLILARNLGTWDPVLASSLGAGKMPELTQVRISLIS